MQKLLFLLCFIALVIACNNPKKETNEASENVAKSTINLPYTPSYSSSFEMGNPAYATMIVQGSWKDWEENKLDNMKNWVADTIVAYQSNDEVIKGLDSLMARWKQGRAGYTSVIDTLDAVLPVYSTDKKENWVLVWATEINTKQDGSKDTVSVMETWRINKSGKADLLFQYDRNQRK
ncbi:MAG TPA: hypothetical protein VFN30_01660 [Chitinophagaceae bacterium]|nr:hypothetical protein [Chitinophagaceae bacterium]